MSETCVGCVERDTDYDLLHAKYKAALREAQLWKNRLAATEALDPTNAEIKGLLEYWHAKVGRDARTKLPLDGDRAKRVRWALKHYEASEIREVIDKLALFPYVWKMGRRAERRPYGTRDQRSDDITAALYSEKTFEKFQSLGEPYGPDERTVVVPAAVIDAMKAKVDRAQWAAAVWRERSEADSATADIALRRLAAKKPHLVAVA